MKKRKFGFIAIFIWIAVNTSAQNISGPKYGNDSVSCVTNLSMYRELYKQWESKNFDIEAFDNKMVAAWREVFFNCPRSSQLIYTNGEKIIEYYIRTNPSNMNVYLDTLCILMDTRANCFPISPKTGESQVEEIRRRKEALLYEYNPSYVRNSTSQQNGYPSSNTNYTNQATATSGSQLVSGKSPNQGAGNEMFGKIAVLDFKAGAGISQNDVNGISAVFTTYFSPRGYTIVERNQVDQVLREQNFQGSSLTEYDMVRLGQILNVNKIVVGDVNILAGEYNVDVRVVDVQGAYVTGRDGASFPQGSGYRQTMKELAERLASQIAIVTSSNVGSNTTNTSNIQNPATPTSPITLHGYLIVYPEDLGVFSSEPTGIISALNNSNSFGHRNWRLPTDEELAVMMGSKGSLNIKGTDYMTIENCRRDNDKSVRLVTLADGFADMNRIITVNGTRYMVMSSDADDLEMYTIEQCNTKRAFGYSDWQEPTIEMLRIMYSRKKMIGGFHDDTYMSKSVGSEHMGMGYYRDTSLGIDFSNGVECDCGHRLRPVRKID